MKLIVHAHAVLALLTFSLWSGLSHAGSCTIITPPNGSTLVNFGQYSVVSGDVDASADITLSCMPTGIEVTVPYSVSIDTGSGSSTFHPRALRLGPFVLSYNLFIDVARTTVFGDGMDSTATVAGSCAAACAPITVHGRIFGAQIVPGGTYTDQVMVTVSF